MPTYAITPEDVLFFRDGRPMEAGAGSGGHGARWPEPSVIFDALHAALHRALPQREEWEHRHDWARSSQRPHKGDQSQRFGSLATAGPFPMREGAWFFPRPQDVTTEDRLAPTLLPMKNPGGHSDLPTPLRHPLASLAEPSKEEPSPWWTKQAIEAYLSGGDKLPAQPWAFSDDSLFAREWHTGIAIDPDTQTTGRGEAAGRIYSAQYLRLRDGVTLGIHATMPMKNGHPDGRKERLTELFPAHRTLIVGGQQRACQVEPLESQNKTVALERLLPLSQRITGERIKWLLLSPAVFPAIADDKPNISAHPGGWLPNWVAPADNFCIRQGDKMVEVPSGQVLLKGEPPRGRGESREAWRDRVRMGRFLDCRLVAARIPKPIVLTGWTERLHLLEHAKADGDESLRHGPRPTLLAVPAGAVYYFEGTEAPHLAEVLSWHGGQAENIQAIQHRRSTLMGEKGFGLGVCGTWSFYEDAKGLPT